MKTVGELKEMLNDYDDDMVVYVYADHGQQPIQFNGVSVEAVEELSYYAEFVDDEDDEGVDEEFPQVLVIGDC